MDHREERGGGRHLITQLAKEKMLLGVLKKEIKESKIIRLNISSYDLLGR
jgi:hypothetical protein